MKIDWSQVALERIKEIADYIARDNPSAAARLVEAIFDRVLLLEDFPHHGRMVPELNRPDIREILFKKYRIIYKLGTDKIVVVTVRHGRQILPIHEILPTEI